MGSNPDNWPPLIQALIYIGGVVAAVVMWLFGGRKRHNGQDDSEHERELAARELNEAIRKLDRAETRSDIQQLRSDMERVLGAMREALVVRIDQGNAEIYRRLSAVEGGLIEVKTELKSRDSSGKHAPSR